jgi:hypothetical protein
MFKRQYLPTSEQAAAVIYQLIVERLEHIHVYSRKVKLLQFCNMLIPLNHQRAYSDR